MKKIYLIFLILSQILLSQIQHQIRGVFLTTNFRLDWPKSNSTVNQKLELSAILQNIKEKKFNTVYFQIRSNGAVLYNSDYELKATFIDNFDALEYAVSEAHNLGLEIYAWLNVFKSGNQNTGMLKSNPDWFLKTNGSGEIWFDPGNPDASSLQLNIIREIITKYDIDGLMLDFIRYPDKSFDDSKTYNQFAEGKNRFEWRRENINNMVEKAHNLIKEIKPFVKLTATPLGIYKNTDKFKGLESKTGVFQDSRFWLESKWVDYLVPQIYWKNSFPLKYEDVVKDWTDFSPKYPIVIGIASYIPEINSKIDEYIKIAENNGAIGIAAFRYENIAEKKINSFDESAVPLSFYKEVQTEKNTNQPLSNVNCIIENINSIKLKFQVSSIPQKNKQIYYGVTTNEKKTKLRELFSGENFTYSLEKPNKVKYTFGLIQFDRFWNENIIKQDIKVTFNKLNEITTNTAKKFSQVRFADDNIYLFANYSGKIDILEKRDNSNFTILKSLNVKEGMNIFKCNVGTKKAEYFIRNSAGKTEKIID